MKEWRVIGDQANCGIDTATEFGVHPSWSPVLRRAKKVLDEKGEDPNYHDDTDDAEIELLLQKRMIE